MDKQPHPEVITVEYGEKGTIKVGHQFGTERAMKKQFGTIATLGVAFSTLNSWVAESASLLAPIALGGPVTIVWGAVLAAIFTGLVCIGVAEMASAMPNAGGPYHYTYMVASRETRKFLSFLVGWSVMIAWWFIISSAALFLAAFIMGMVVLTHPSFVPTAWQVWLLYVAIIMICTGIVIGANTIMSLLTTASLYWSLSGFFICIITTVAMHRNQPYRDASFVFADFANESGWSDDGTAFVIGWMLSTYNFLGIDAATHLSEEMPHPEREVPRAMAGALVAGLLTALLFLISLLFCTTNIHEVALSPTGAPVLAIFKQATGSNAAAIGLTSLIAISTTFSEISGILVAGRTTWAFARDNGMPFSKFFSEVDEVSGMPVRATLLSALLSIAYGAVYIGSAVAFQLIVASCVVMLFTAYVAPQAILAIRGRQYLPERYYDLGKIGRFLNALAPILVLFSVVILCFPSELPLTTGTMNYLSVIVVGCWILVVGFYLLVKKGKYEGPILEHLT